ncbi:MAG: hypothetical protein HY084_10585 [Gemmatimonadetes bacterium]|nr:hypothetical protein [Gemmatimonadota bacterium]
MNVKRVLVLSMLALAACGGDKKKEAEDAAATKQVSPDEYRKKQQAFADSVINAASSSKAVVEKLGKGYEVGGVRMRDTVSTLAAKTTCFQNGRNADPYLAGTVSFFAHMNVTGSDVIYVQESKWTSQAGNIVDACLNEASRQWKLDGTFGAPNAYIVQVQFK